MTKKAPAEVEAPEKPGGRGEHRADELNQIQDFAEQLFDRQSPTYNNLILSYRAVYGHDTTVTQLVESRRAQRVAATKACRRFREKILLRGDDGQPITHSAFVRLLLDREEKYATRGERGDAQASAAVLQMIGVSMGFIDGRKGKGKDSPKPPTGQATLMTGDQIVDSIMVAAERLRRLRESNPVTRVLPGNEIAVVEAPVRLEDRVVMDAEQRRRFCVNHPQKTAHYLTWDSEAPRCMECLRSEPVAK